MQTMSYSSVLNFSLKGSILKCMVQCSTVLEYMTLTGSETQKEEF